MYRAPIRPGTASGWKQRQENAAAREAARKAYLESDEFRERARLSAEMDEAHRVAMEADRKRRKWDVPVEVPAWLAKGGKLHATRVAWLAKVFAEAGFDDATDPHAPMPGAEAPFARANGGFDLTRPNPQFTDLVLAPSALAGAAEVPRRRGRPPRIHPDGALEE